MEYVTLSGLVAEKEKKLSAAARSFLECGRFFSMEYVTLSGLVAVEEKKLSAAARNSTKVKKSSKRNETPQGRRPCGAQTSNLWLCYAKHNIWLRHRKVRSQAFEQSGDNVLGEKQPGKLGEVKKKNWKYV